MRGSDTSTTPTLVGNHPEKPPGLEVAVHHRCEALKVVITKKAIPKRLAFDQQFCDIPRQADQGSECKAAQRFDALRDAFQISAHQSKQRQGHATEDHGHRAFCKNGRGEQNPGEPPSSWCATGITTPLAEQAQSEGAAE